MTRRGQLVTMALLWVIFAINAAIVIGDAVRGWPWPIRSTLFAVFALVGFWIEAYDVWLTRRSQPHFPAASLQETAEWYAD